MKALYILLLLFISGSTCGPQGDSGNAAHQAMDSLKNRTKPSAEEPVRVSLNTIFSGENDTSLYSNNDWGTVSGYIVLAKWGGSETCNCHSKNQDDFDVHIELCPTPKLNPEKVMVCEISRYTRPIVVMDLADIKKLAGKKVSITGWLFFDKEHKQNAYNTNPKGGDLWRGTCWEIHPVFEIKILD